VVSSVNACGESASSAQAVTAGAGPYGGTARPVPGTIQAEDYDLGGQGVGFNDTTAGNGGGKYRIATGRGRRHLQQLRHDLLRRGRHAPASGRATR
jgi:hypothetical protein